MRAANLHSTRAGLVSVSLVAARSSLRAYPGRAQAGELAIARLTRKAFVRRSATLCALLGIGMLASGLGASGARAQSAFPSHPLTMVVPLPAGGTADLLARLTAEKLHDLLGQQVIVENRPGGVGGLVGTEAVFRAAPDGYTLLCAPQLTFSVSHLLFPKLSFDPRKFEPVGVLAAYPMVLLGRADLPANSLPELIDYARANPGKVNYGDQGKGQTGQLTGEAINYRAKIHMVEIPYRGSAPAITDLLAGQIDLVPDYLLANKSFIDGGKLKLLGVGSRDRLKDYPKVATFAETFPGFYADTWMAIVAPPGTPNDITKKLSDAVGQAYQTADLRQRIVALQAQPLGGTPDEMRAMIRASTQQWAPVIEAGKITIE
jgi:tripartite-type tricarboxylate transporter receptor subunit TctC